MNLRYPDASPSVVTIAILASLATLAVPPSAHAGWNFGGVTVKSTTDSITLVAACNDGSYGTLVGWHEESSPGRGILRAQHLLPTGDLDPAWPTAGMIACTTATTRSDLTAIPDGLGGFYLWWLSEPPSPFNTPYLVLTRVTGSGAVASGWPLAGRSFGPVAQNELPCVISDGANGVYAAWTTFGFGDDPWRVMGVHLGPGNLSAAGWAGLRALSLGHEIPTTDHAPRLALAPDGGVFVSWSIESSDTTIVPHRRHLGRRTPAGVPSPGWTVGGVELGPVDYDEVVHREVGLMDIAPDGSGNLYVFIADPIGYDSVTELLYRYLENGQPAPGWPSGGVGYPYGNFIGEGPRSSRRVLPDAAGAIYLGAPSFTTHTPASFQWNRYSVSGEYLGGTVLAQEAYDICLRGGGGLFVTSTKRTTDYPGRYSYGASIYMGSDPSAPGYYSEQYSEYDYPNVTFFGDVAIAPSGDGGAVGFFSRVRDEQGLFARRLGPNGEITGVEEPGPTVSFSARWVVGQGIAARIHSASGGGRVDVFDVQGRRVSSVTIAPDAAGREIELPGSGTLSSGVYLVRLESVRGRSAAKVLITR